MSKKKSGSIAIPFLLTFLISLIIIGGAAMIIYQKIDAERNKLSEMEPVGAALSDEDSHTIMFMLDLSDVVEMPEETEPEEEETEEEEDEDEDEDDETYDWEVDETEEEEEKKPVIPQQYTFMIMRSMPYHKEILFVGLPNTMVLGQENKKAEAIYKEGGITELTSAAEYSLDINIDRFVKMDSKAFGRLVDMVGGASYVIPGGVEGFSDSAEEQFLGSEDMEKLIRYGGYSGGETQRISTAASIICAMINQANGERLAANLDNMYEELIDMVDSDISAMDYNDSKEAIQFMLKYSGGAVIESETAGESAAEDKKSEDKKDKKEKKETKKAKEEKETKAPAADSPTKTLAVFMTPYGSQSDEEFILDPAFVNEISIYFERPQEKKEHIPEDDASSESKAPKKKSGGEDE